MLFLFLVFQRKTLHPPRVIHFLLSPHTHIHTHTHTLTHKTIAHNTNMNKTLYGDRFHCFFPTKNTPPTPHVFIHFLSHTHKTRIHNTKMNKLRCVDGGGIGALAYQPTVWFCHVCLPRMEMQKIEIEGAEVGKCLIDAASSTNQFEGSVTKPVATGHSFRDKGTRKGSFPCSIVICMMVMIALTGSRDSLGAMVTLVCKARLIWAVRSF